MSLPLNSWTKPELSDLESAFFASSADAVTARAATKQLAKTSRIMVVPRRVNRGIELFLFFRWISRQLHRVGGDLFEVRRKTGIRAAEGPGSRPGQQVLKHRV